MRIALVALALAIYSGITFYLGWNFKVWLQSLNIYRWPAVFWVLLVAVALGYFVGKLHPLLAPFYVMGSYWFFILQYGIVLCMIANVLVKWTPLTTKVAGLGVVGILIMLFAIGTYNAYSPVVRELSIEMDKPGKDMRIVVASDFHLGILSNKRHLNNFVALSNEAAPDLVLLVGDLVDDSPTRFIDVGMGEVMGSLTSTYGVYGVLGNHEYYGNEIPRFKQAMKDANVEILMDETILVDNRFYITGREDLTNRNRLDLAQLVPENTQLPWIVMDHTPMNMTIPAETGVDLHVSGHTHLGQMWPNELITRRTFELDYGYALKEKMHALVSSGYGFWGPPIRTNSRSELWVIDVKFTKD